MTAQAERFHASENRGLFLVLMTACGQTVRDVAQLTGNLERTVNRWIAGRWDVPADVLQMLEQLDFTIEHHAIAILADMRAGICPPTMAITRAPGPVPNLRKLPELPNPAALLAVAARVRAFGPDLETRVTFLALD